MKWLYKPVLHTKYKFGVNILEVNVMLQVNVSDVVEDVLFTSLTNV